MPAVRRVAPQALASMPALPSRRCTTRSTIASTRNNRKVTTTIRSRACSIPAGEIQPVSPVRERAASSRADGFVHRMRRPDRNAILEHHERRTPWVLRTVAQAHQLRQMKGPTPVAFMNGVGERNREPIFPLLGEKIRRPFDARVRIGDERVVDHALEAEALLDEPRSLLPHARRKACVA